MKKAVKSIYLTLKIKSKRKFEEPFVKKETSTEMVYLLSVKVLFFRYLLKMKVSCNLRKKIIILRNISIQEFVLQRPEKYGGDIIFDKYEDLEKAFADKVNHSFHLRISK